MIPKDFDSLLFSEAQRQHNVVEKAWESLDLKLQFIIGLAIGVLSYLLTQVALLEVLKSGNCVLIGLFIFGVIVIIFGIAISFTGFVGKSYQAGVDIMDVHKARKSTVSILIKSTVKAMEINKIILKKKKSILDSSMFLIGMGTLVLVLVRVIHFVAENP